MEEEEVVVTPEEQTPDESQEVDESVVEETSEAPVEGQADDEFDPDSYVDSLELPDDRKKILKESLMRHGDYTKKTQALAQERSLVQKWSPVLNKLVSDQKLFDLVMGYGSESKGTPEARDEIPQDPREFAEHVKNQTIQEMRQTMAVERDLEQASNLDPRLQSQQPADVHVQRIIAGIVAQDSDVLGGRKSYTQGVADALAWYDNEYFTGVTKGVQATMNRKVQEKRLVSPKGSSPISTKINSSPASIMDSYKETLTELGME